MTSEPGTFFWDSHIFPVEMAQILGNSQDFSQERSAIAINGSAVGRNVVRSSLLEQTTPVGLKVSDTAPEITNIQFSDQDPAEGMGLMGNFRGGGFVGGVGNVKRFPAATLLKS